ncbi:MAG: class I fructose-bisphosphate aldolase [Candidatus Gracilibacteria bacterium]|jgi:fructose-bisphosphate aldolase class I
MDLQILSTTAKAMVAPGKGILAIDESHATCKKRFDALGVECTEDTRREYRELLVTAPEIEKSVAGMILFDETIRQSSADGRKFVDILSAKGILAGIKVDGGTKALALHAGEVVTEGLDGLRERLAEYKSLGAKFAKWRAVITIAEGSAGALPSMACVKSNAHALARYAALCQEADIVPMVEPEIMMDGAHTIEKCYEVTALTLKTLFAEMAEQGVAPQGTILKVSMVLSGKDCPTQADEKTVAEMTLKVLKENVPANLAGVVFLSGGQSSEKSTVHLNEINKIAVADGGKPWPVSFSYGRAIQKPALNKWAETKKVGAVDGVAVAEAQKLLVEQADRNSLASMGKFAA